MEKDDAWSDIIAPSLLGQACRPKIAASNQLPWIRTALAFVHFDAVLFESLAEKIGIQCATEVLLLAIARACEKKQPLWVQARDLGIPWVAKTWSGLGKLQRKYNDGVRLHPLESIEEVRVQNLTMMTLNQYLVVCFSNHLVQPLLLFRTQLSLQLLKTLAPAKSQDHTLLGLDLDVHPRLRLRYT